MDEKELETLFRSAPGDPPAPGFTLTDVTKRSARVTKRRRSALLAAACLVVLAAAGITGVTYFSGTETQTAQPVLAPAQPQGPRAEGASGCDTVDQALATALAAELPATGAPSPARVCTPDSRSAGFPVAGGVVSVIVSPSPFTLHPFDDGTVAAEQPTASGGSLVVLSTPDPGSAAPLASQLPRIAAALAGRF